jgi:hypothetical protein|tara:strand:- start:241 stop:456 length:216 start_codon:yes stop_codon:yes gene_type:complete
MENLNIQIMFVLGSVALVATVIEKVRDVIQKNSLRAEIDRLESIIDLLRFYLDESEHANAKLSKKVNKLKK